MDNLDHPDFTCHIHRIPKSRAETMSEFPTGPPAALKGEQNDEAAGVAQAGSTLPDMPPGGEGERGGERVRGASSRAPLGKQPKPGNAAGESAQKTSGRESKVVVPFSADTQSLGAVRGGGRRQAAAKGEEADAPAPAADAPAPHAKKGRKSKTGTPTNVVVKEEAEGGVGGGGGGQEAGVSSSFRKESRNSRSVPHRVSHIRLQTAPPGLYSRTMPMALGWS